MKTIRLIVNPQGETRIETHGFTGDECRQASQFLEQALGHKASETLKAEYYQAAVSDQRLEQKQ